jgi:hypothetical protein
MIGMAHPQECDGASHPRACVAVTAMRLALSHRRLAPLGSYKVCVKKSVNGYKE